MILLFSLNTVRADLLETSLETLPSANSLKINTILLHDETENWQNGVRPKNAIIGQGGTQSLTMKLYIHYINTTTPVYHTFNHRIELYRPGIARPIYTDRYKFSLEDIAAKYGTFQRALVVRPIVFPSVNSDNPSHFGIYTIKVYVNDELKKEFVVPLFTR
jgi:hypothetical protein